MKFLETDQYKGLTLDIEAFPETSRGDYKQLVQELYGDLQSKGLKLYIAVPVNDKEFDYSAIAQFADGLILMNYDEHYPGGMPGAVASQDWFVKNLARCAECDSARKDHRRNRQLRLRLGKESRAKRRARHPRPSTTCRCRTPGWKPKKPTRTSTSTAMR